MIQGTKLDADKPRMELLSPIAIIEVSKVLSFGAKKYGDNNWRKGLAFTRVIAAILRHTLSYLSGQTYDPETKLSHAAHIMTEAMFLLELEVTRPDLDDRYKISSNTSASSVKSD